MFDLQKLLPRHYSIIDHFLDGELTIKEIARKMKMTPVGIRNIRNSPTFQHELALRRKQRDNMYDELKVRDKTSDEDKTSEIIHNHTEQAAQRIADLLSDEDKTISLKSAAELLDRGGYPKAAKLEQTSKVAVVVLDPSDLNRIERTLDLDKG